MECPLKNIIHMYRTRYDRYTSLIKDGRKFVNENFSSFSWCDSIQLEYCSYHHKLEEEKTESLNGKCVVRIW